MDRLISGAIIKQLRQSKKMTQEELANEICSTRNLRKIEKGEHSTTQIVFERLLEKLGEDSTKYYFHSQSITDNEIYDTIVEIRDLIQKRDYHTARDKYSELRKNATFMSSINASSNPTGKIYRQYTLFWESVFLQNIEGKSEEALEMAYKAIYETRGEALLNDIENNVLFEQEYVILNAIALLHFCLSEVNESIELLSKLNNSLKKTAISKQIKLRFQPLICCNLSKFLGMQKRYAEADTICDEGIDACEDAQTNRNLGYLYYNKAVSLYHLNSADLFTIREYFMRAYHSFLAVKDEEMSNEIKRNALEKYGISL